MILLKRNIQLTITEEYLDRYKGVKSEILNTTRFDENSDLSTTYLVRSNMVRDHKMVVEERFPMLEQWYTTGKLLDCIKWQILIVRFWISLGDWGRVNSKERQR